MIPVSLPSGREILIPTNADLPGVESAPHEQSETFADVAFHLEFQDIVDVATEIGTMLRGAMDKIRPQKASVELNIGVDARTGRLTAFFVDGGASGSMKLTLEWESQPTTTDPT